MTTEWNCGFFACNRRESGTGESTVDDKDMSGNESGIAGTE
jgi:hypothetical protein